uniref:Histone H4 transcription factor n=1 Tax=Schistosoma haematobium TaxID=6185 RepID=A0A095CGA5_SCHHA
MEACFEKNYVSEKWPHSISIAPIHGPLAQAGALPNVQADISTPTDNDTTPCAIVDVFVCPHNGCNFKTNKRNGYLVHIGRKHHPLPSNSSLESSSDRPYSTDNSPNTSKERLYKCHMCSVVKRRGNELSKHLVRDHHLARPSGHVRFTYTISDDGHYRLQLTRLDTVRVAAQLLGETVVSKLLVETRNQQLSICE